jgi:DNA mismatch endonuclease (patch repair protein)
MTRILEQAGAIVLLKGPPSRKRKRGSPTFVGLKSSSLKASEIASRIRKTDSRAEVALRKALWRRGARYRKNARGLIGTPDLVFASPRVVVFCDGDFWHGRGWNERKRRLQRGANASYWISKIERNRARDRQVSRKLKADGWVVVRLWERDVLADVGAAATRVLEVLQRRRP